MVKWAEKIRFITIVGITQVVLLTLANLLSAKIAYSIKKILDSNMLWDILCLISCNAITPLTLLIFRSDID